MKKARPFAMSIAGFDPSGGAGVLADIKTFEAIKVNGLAVCTCITFQNEDEFIGLEWIKSESIINQIDILFKKYNPEYIKIGLIENIITLEHIINHLLSLNNNIKIIWDPVFKSSTGFDFHKKINFQEIEKILLKIYLVTPNIIEIKQLMNSENSTDSAKQLSKYCNVFLKGGHNEEKFGYDYLFTSDKCYSFRPKILSKYNKHGSGCVISSVICAFLSKGFKLHKACLHGKYYITKFLETNSSLLGYHKL